MPTLRMCVVITLCFVLRTEAIAASRLLLMTGDSLPSTRGDATVGTIERIRFNRIGELFISADANTSNGQFAGVWRTDVQTGATVLVFEDGVPVPGIDGAFFDEPYSEDIGVDVGNSGGVGLIVSYSTPDANVSGHGTWYWENGTGLTQLLLHQDPAPGLEDRFVFDPEVGSVNGRAGLATVFANTVTRAGVESRDNATWMRDEAGEYHVVAVTGSAAPGMPDLVLDGEPKIEWVNRHGQYLLEATVNSAGGTPLESRRTIWLADEGLDGSLTHLLTQGDALPIAGETVPASGTFNIQGFNDHATVLVSGNYASPEGDNRRGVWTYDSGSGWNHVVSEGDELPGLEAFRFEQVSAVDISDDGKILIQNDHPDFHAHHGSGLWLGTTDGLLDPVVIAGEPAPGTDGFFSDFGTAARNARGQIAMEGRLENETQFDPSDDESAIWAQDLNGAFHVVVRDGSMLDVGDGMQWPASDLSLVGIDDAGNVLFSADLGGDLGTAFFVSDVVAVPEPVTMTYAITALLMLMRARRAASSAHDSFNRAREFV